MVSSSARYSNNFNYGNISKMYTSYDDQDSGNAIDFGDNVSASTYTSISPPHSLWINAFSNNTPSNTPKAFATTAYLRNWETAKDYFIKFYFYLNRSSNGLIIIETVDVYLYVKYGTYLYSYSAISNNETNLSYSLPMRTWKLFNISVDKDGSVLLRIGPWSRPFDRYSNDVEPRSILFGDPGDDSTASNRRGEGYWDDLILDYQTVNPGIEVDAGDDIFAEEGRSLDFHGFAVGSLKSDQWPNHIFGDDVIIANNSTGQRITWVTSYSHPQGGAYPGLVAVEYGQGRAVYAPGDGISPRLYNRDRHYQIFVNSVKWASNKTSAEQTYVLVTWGYRDLVTYRGASWNGVDALRSEGYHVNTSQFIPATDGELDLYDVIVIRGTGWTGGIPVSQQGVNNGWCSTLPSCTEGRNLNEQEGQRLANYVYRGGGFVASSEYNEGDHLNEVSNYMNVWFNGKIGTPYTANRIVTHPIMDKWGGRRANITSWQWDFGDGSMANGQNVTHAYGHGGTYIVTLTVTDETGAQANDTLVANISNVPPTVYAEANTTWVYEGHEFTVNGSFDDPSWLDSHDAYWDFVFHDDMRNAGPNVSADFWPKQNHTNHRVNSTTWIYGDDGNYTIYLNVTDDMGGFGSASVRIWAKNLPPELVGKVNVTIYRNAPRTLGYWKHQCSIQEPRKDHPGIRQEWIDAIANQSQLFSWISTKAEVCAVLDPPTPISPLENAKRQLMALWLNIVSGLLFIDSPLHHPRAPGYDSIREFLFGDGINEGAESIVMRAEDSDPSNDPSDAELEWVASIADDINNDANGVADYQYIDPAVQVLKATARDAGTDDIIFVWNDGLGHKIMHRYNNSASGADPIYNSTLNEVRSPWGTYPFEVSDKVVMVYPIPSQGIQITSSLECLIDDDGGAYPNASACQLIGSGLSGQGDEIIEWTFSFTTTYRVIEGGFIIAEVWVTVYYVDPLVELWITGGFLP